MSGLVTLLVICVGALATAVVWLLALRDSERRQEELRVLFAEDRTFVEELQQPFCELATDGAIREWNEELAELTGESSRNALGKPIGLYVVDNDGGKAFHAAIEELFARDRRGERAIRVQIELRKVGSRTLSSVPVAASLWLTMFPEEKRVCVLLHDLSEENSMLRQKEAMLHRERQLVEQLRAADAEKTEFIATVSHELRTPLTSIVGYIEMMNDDYAGELNEKQRDMLSAIDRNSQRLLALIEDVLILSRVESRTVALRAVKIHSRDLLSGVAQALYPVMQQKGITCEIEVDDTCAEFEADYGQIERVLLNTATNAAKFTEPGGTIKLMSSGDNSFLTLQVVDNGCGMSPADLAQATERFYRAPGSAEKGVPGSGLGLSIVKSIVERHHGELQLTSNPGEGTVVTIRLPRIFRGNTALDGV